jgi:hypothetical protein
MREGIGICPKFEWKFVFILARCLSYGMSHRTNTEPKIRQTATHVSDGNQFRRCTGRIIVLETRECLRLPDEARRGNWATMEAVTVYRLEDGNNN